jgi:hypothetical protein
LTNVFSIAFNRKLSVLISWICWIDSINHNKKK